MLCAQALGEAAQLLWWACGSAARADARQQRRGCPATLPKRCLAVEAHTCLPAT